MKTAFYNAKVYVDPGHFEEAILVEDGLITAVGSAQEILSMNPEEKVDCFGKTMIPGFNDSHSHLMMISSNRQHLQLMEAKSIDDVLHRGREFLKERPHLKVLYGLAWNPSYFTSGEMRNLTRHDLDKISTDIPILLVRACGHMIVCNTKALELSGVTSETPQVPGGVFEIDEDGPNGCFFENAKDLIDHLRPFLTKEEMLEALKETFKYALSLGITTVQTNDLGLMYSQEDALYVYDHLYKDQNIATLRTHHQICFDSPEDFDAFAKEHYFEPTPSPKMTWGPLKLFKDGTLGGHSALLSEAYLGEPENFGVDVLPIEKTKPFIDVAKKHKIQVVAHCIGDRAMSEMMESYRPISPEDRYGLVHCQITKPEVLEEMAKDKVLGIIQPIFLRSDITSLQGAIDERIQETSYAWKTMLGLGIPIAVGTDSPIEDLNPFANLYSAILRRNLQGVPTEGFHMKEALTIEEAVDAYTIGSAYAEFKEEVKGRLKPGYYADMVLLDQDIFTIRPEDLLGVNVLKTYVHGELAYERK